MSVPLRAIGVTDRFDLTLSHYEQVCTSLSGHPPVLSVLECATMQEALPRCKQMMKVRPLSPFNPIVPFWRISDPDLNLNLRTRQDECEDRFDALSCQAALAFCYAKIRTPFSNTGLNPYDISKPCEGYLCYGSISSGISAYLDDQDVRAFLGIDAHVPPFVGCSASVGMDFNNHMDGTGKTYLYVASLLEHGIKVLVRASHLHLGAHRRRFGSS
jgi:hypothetical protein